MNVLVTKTEPAFFYKVEEDRLTLLNLYDFSNYELFPDNQTIVGTLPTEIGERVITYLFWGYVRDRDFYMANCLLNINKYMLGKFFEQFYRMRSRQYVQMYKKLSKSLFHLESIDDHLLGLIKEDHNACLRLTRVGAPFNPSPMRPWHFGAYSLTEMMANRFYKGNRPVKVYAAGPKISDIVWIDGIMNREGIIVDACVFHPVINLVYCNVVDNILPEVPTFENDYYFRKFVNIVKYVYGPNTLINVMVKEDENPFVVTTNSFISL